MSDTSLIGPQPKIKVSPLSAPFVCYRNISQYSYSTNNKLNSSSVSKLRSEAWKQAVYFNRISEYEVPHSLLFDTLVADTLQINEEHYSKKSLLSACSHESDSFLIFATGRRLSQLAILPFSSCILPSKSENDPNNSSRMSSPKTDPSFFLDCFNEPLQEISVLPNTSYSATSHILVRTSAELSYLSTASVSPALRANLIQPLRKWRFNDSVIASMSPGKSRYPHATVLTSNENLYLWDLDTGITSYLNGPVLPEFDNTNISCMYPSLHLEQSLQAQVVWIARKKDIFSVDVRHAPHVPAQLHLTLSASVRGLIQHDTLTDYLIASTANHLLLLDRRFTKAPVAQRPISFPNELMRLYSNQGSASSTLSFSPASGVDLANCSILLGCSPKSTDIALHTMEINDFGSPVYSEKMSASLLLSASSMPTMRGVALECATFPVIDLGENSTLCGVDIIVTSTRKDKTNKSPFLVQLSSQGDIYTQPLCIASPEGSTSVLIDDKKGATRVHASKNQFPSSSSSSSSSFHNSFKKRNPEISTECRVPLPSNTLLPIVSETDLQRFDVVFVNPKALRVPTIPVHQDSQENSQVQELSFRIISEYTNQIRAALCESTVKTLWELWKLIVSIWQETHQASCRLDSLELRKGLLQIQDIEEITLSSPVRQIIDGLEVNEDLIPGTIQDDVDCCSCHDRLRSSIDSTDLCSSRYCLSPHLLAYRLTNLKPDTNLPKAYPKIIIGSFDSDVNTESAVTEEALLSLISEWK